MASVKASIRAKILIEEAIGTWINKNLTIESEKKKQK